MEKDQKETKKEGKGLFGKLHNLVFEEDKNEDVEKENTETAGVKTTGSFNYSNVSQNQSPGMVIPNVNGVFDQKIYDSFLKVIEKNNIEGIDYYEFSKAKKANDSIPGFTDQMKFQSAFHTLRANYPTLTKQILNETANFYIEKLDEEEKSFNEEMQSEIASQITTRLNQAKGKQDEIAEKNEQIQKLQAEMTQLNGEIGALNVEAQNTQLNIDNTAKNFKVSLEVLKGQINQDKANIQQFIQE